jgi:D-3-phosphoglycerate dehydrogenase
MGAAIIADLPSGPSTPFQGESKTILSPHIWGVTGDAYVNMGVGAAQNVLAVLQAHAQAA